MAVGSEERAHAWAAALDLLADERLTGMTREEFAALAALLAPAQAAQTAQRCFEQRCFEQRCFEQRCFEQRGGPRRRAPGTGGTGLLSAFDRVLITVVYLRQVCSQNVLSDLLGVNANSIGQAIVETRQLLTEHARTIAPTTLRFTTAAALREFVAHGQVEPPRTRVSELLSDPALTGMTRAELAAMTERVGRVQ